MSLWDTLRLQRFAKHSGLPALSGKIHVFYQNNNAAAEFMRTMREAGGLVTYLRLHGKLA